MPHRIQRSRAKGWRMPPGAVYVGRPSRWGNPWKPGDGPLLGPPDSAYENHGFYLDELLAIGAFERLTVPERLGTDPAWLEPLRDHDLACWCPLDKPCHADVLLELANPAIVPG